MKEAIKQMFITVGFDRPTVRLVLKAQGWLSKRWFAKIDHPYGKRFERIFVDLEKADAKEGRDLILEIEQERKRMLLRTEPLVDGSLGEGGLYDKNVSIQAACRVSKWPKAALLLYFLIREFKPSTVLELGTNVGISSAYQAAALKLNGQNSKLITLESSPYRLKLAKELHKNLGLENIVYIQGLFTETLEKTLAEFNPIDFAFIDGHHQYQPTLDYFDKIWKHSWANSIFVFDDIRWSDGMKQAWRELQADRRMSVVIDLNPMGICVGSRQPYAKRYVLPTVHPALS